MNIQGTRFRMQKKIFDFLLAVSCLLFSVCGCGYTMYGKAALPFESIMIGTIENKTVEPKLHDKLYQSLTEEFLKQGIRVSPDAGYKLSGVINQFDLIILSEKNGVATGYEVTIRGDFELVMPSGDVRNLKGMGSPFIVSFQSNDMLEDVIANKERASEKAIRDMAMEIVANLIYR